MVQIETRVGTFEVINKNGKAVVCKNDKVLATLDCMYWDKDSIIRAIESNGEELSKAAAKVGTGNITEYNVVLTLEHIYGLLNGTIKDKQTRGFVTSRLKQVINKLAA